MALLFKETTILDQIRYELNHISQDLDKCLCRLSDEQIIRVLLPRITEIYISEFASKTRHKLKTYDDIPLRTLHESEIILSIITHKMSEKRWMSYVNCEDLQGGFPGDIEFRSETYSRVVKDVWRSMSRAWEETTQDEKTAFALGGILYLDKREWE